MGGQRGGKSVSEAAHPDANIIFGAMVDEKLEDEVWVTVVATGYGDEGRRKSLRRLREPAGGEVTGPALGSRAPAAARSQATSSRYPSSSPASEGGAGESPPGMPALSLWHVRIS